MPRGAPPNRLRVVLAGLGFFSQFHAAAWLRLAGAELVAAADPDPDARERFRARFPDVPAVSDLAEALDAFAPDVLDVVTRPEQHGAAVLAAFERHVDVICQKPLAPTMPQAAELADAARRLGVRLLVHDNWRFQPWWIAVRSALEQGLLGDVFMARLSIRAGDGRGTRPFSNQPYFRDMPRFFFYETAIHSVDLARSLFGEVGRVCAAAGRVRPDIAGEDLGAALLKMTSGTVVIVEGNRWSEAPAANEAMGEGVVEGTLAVARVEGSGRALLKPIGRPERALFEPERRARLQYRGDSVYRTIDHLAEALRTGNESPLEARSYLRTMRVVFDIYEQLEHRGA